MTWKVRPHRSAWARVASRVPQPYELLGLTFHGEDAPAAWVAVIWSEELSTYGPEGAGKTPMEALKHLEDQMAEWSPRGGSHA